MNKFEKQCSNKRSGIPDTLLGDGKKKKANEGNPPSGRQISIIKALNYYFDLKLFAKNASDAYDMISQYKNRIKTCKNEVYIDGHLIKKGQYIVNGAPKNKKEEFIEITEDDINDIFYRNEPEMDYEYSNYKDSYDPTDMSTWDDDDWINFELDH